MICIDGECLEVENAKIGHWITTEGFQFGLGVFETLRVYQKQPEDLEAHLNRLKSSAAALGISMPESLMEASALLKGIQPLLEEAALPFAVLKIGLIKAGPNSHWWAQIKPFTYKKSMLYQGFKVTVANTRRNSTSLLTAHKTINYAENWIEKQKSVENGYQEVLFLNESAWLAEGAVSNLFMIKEGKWYTPKLTCGLLNGIIRQRLINKILEAGGEVTEGLFNLEFLREADAVFLTNALMGVMPVSQINDTVLNAPSDALITFLEQVDPIRVNFE